jgi:negative regulator of flagellin synthesis FlgM
MKIENNSLNPLSTRKTDETRAAENTRRTSSSTRTESKDKAQVSDQARMLAKARAVFESTPDVRFDRVESIRQQITDGNYQVNYSGLARKMFVKGHDKAS